MGIEKEPGLVHCSDNRIRKWFPCPARRPGSPLCSAGISGRRGWSGAPKKPFFRFLIPHCLKIGGLIGEPSIEVWFSPEVTFALERFLALLPEGSGWGDNALKEEHRKLFALVYGSPE